jgi:hypothetical protein
MSLIWQMLIPALSSPRKTWAKHIPMDPLKYWAGLIIAMCVDATF